jgi:hypothetical protein
MMECPWFGDGRVWEPGSSLGAERDTKRDELLVVTGYTLVPGTGTSR